MASEETKMEEIRIVLFGRTGHGKSTVGNTLLGGNFFSSSGRSRSCTVECLSQETIRDGVRLVVCDTPGFLDTGVSHDEIKKQLMKALVLTTPGFNVVAFVLQRGRFTEEMQKTTTLFLDFFGGDVKEYFCVICTNAEEDELQEFLQDPSPELSQFLDQCRWAIFPFEKKASTSVKNEQVQKFLQHARKIKGNNENKYFSNPIYSMVNEMACKREQEIKRKEMEIKEQERLAYEKKMKEETDKLEQARLEMQRKLAEVEKQALEEHDTKIKQQQEKYKKEMEMELEKMKERENERLETEKRQKEKLEAEHRILELKLKAAEQGNIDHEAFRKEMNSTTNTDAFVNACAYALEGFTGYVSSATSAVAGWFGY